jgi:hypothetical protein
MDTEPDIYGPPCSKPTGKPNSWCVLWEGHEGECAVITNVTSRNAMFLKGKDGFYREIPVSEDELGAWIDGEEQKDHSIPPVSLWEYVVADVLVGLAATLVAIVTGIIISLLSA